MKKKTEAGRGAKYDSTDIHDALFPRPPKRRTLAELKAGIEDHMRQAPQASAPKRRTRTTS